MRDFPDHLRSATSSSFVPFKIRESAPLVSRAWQCQPDVAIHDLD